MKALMLLFDSELAEEVFTLMKLAQIVHYTYFKGLHGSGNQGKKEGSITWPGNNELLLVLVNEADLENFKNIVKEFKKNKAMPTGLLFFHWPLTEMIV